MRNGSSRGRRLSQSQAASRSLSATPARDDRDDPTCIECCRPHQQCVWLSCPRDLIRKLPPLIVRQRRAIRLSRKSEHMLRILASAKFDLTGSTSYHGYWRWGDSCSLFRNWVCAFEDHDEASLFDWRSDRPCAGHSRGGDAGDCAGGGFVEHLDWRPRDGAPVRPSGTDGGTTGGIEWVNLDGQTIIADGLWHQYTWNFGTDPVTNFSGGNGVLSSATMKGRWSTSASSTAAGTSAGKSTCASTTSSTPSAGRP